jgi:hypothetical protein
VVPCAVDHFGLPHTDAMGILVYRVLSSTFFEGGSIVVVYVYLYAPCTPYVYSILYGTLVCRALSSTFFEGGSVVAYCVYCVVYCACV